jgi:hypothetical protein
MVHVGPALVADGEAAEAVDPSEAALDDPSVAAELLATVDPAAGDAVFDAATRAGAPAAAVVGFVGVQLVRSASRPTRFPVTEQMLEGDAVVDVGAGQQES